MVYFHRPLPLSACMIKMFPPLYTLWHRYINIYRYNVCLFFFLFLASDKMSLSVFELLQPPRSQSLVDGFILAGAEVFGAVWG